MVKKVNGTQTPFARSQILKNEDFYIKSHLNRFLNSNDISVLLGQLWWWEHFVFLRTLASLMVVKEEKVWDNWWL